MYRRSIIGFVILFTAAAAGAQPAGTSSPGAIRSEARLQAFHFGNFFWASDPALQQDVNAAGAELRTAWRWSERPAEVYGQASFVKYDDGDLDDGYGARAGIAQDGKVHDFNVYADYAANRPSVGIRNTFSTADVTTLAGRYAYQISPSWQIGAEGVHERQKFKTQSERDNSFLGGAGVVRYNGFGWRVTPQVAYGGGTRDVDNADENYGERSWRAGVEAIPRDPLYLSLMYRSTRRTYDTSSVLSPNFGKHENDGQWELIAAIRSSPRVQWMLYLTRDRVESPATGESFDANVALAGVAFGF